MTSRRHQTKGSVQDFVNNAILFHLSNPYPLNRLPIFLDQLRSRGETNTRPFSSQILYTRMNALFLFNIRSNSQISFFFHFQCKQQNSLKKKVAIFFFNEPLSSFICFRQLYLFYTDFYSQIRIRARPISNSSTIQKQRTRERLLCQLRIALG